ncbi:MULTISPECIES: hypothetical protein [unclassified Serratia (in: enterobacteria)]|uniref:hypothetical protein n=1 Tax=unclassified Serratia (in: enterobacteria) TaxID=2647522 RepID=UPI0027E79FC4|nr:MULTISPECIES: hypothetical protein [unclassified Serratia (in: enterobacteria)]MDQ7101907.1 hypothetical protein [Serratia sp. MF2]MDQ7104483.1 hypothetical protein [Serratia sp. MF1(2023)]
MKIKPGKIFYSCWPYTDDKGRVEITIDEWEVRNIRRKRNSQSQYGVPKAFPNETRYVNLTMRGSLTQDKNGLWFKNIPACCRSQFPEDKGPGDYLFTTQLQALKFALTVAESPAETRAVKSRITKLRNAKKKKNA